MENSSLHFSLESFIHVLENLVATESHTTRIPWVSISRLNELVHEKYGVEIENILQSQKYSFSLIFFLRNSKIFAIYRTQNIEEFHIALLTEIMPPTHQPFSSLTSARSYQLKRLKRPWKIDRRLLEILRSKSTQLIKNPGSKKSLDRPQLKLQIESLEDLKQTLVEIMNILSQNCQEESLTVASLTSKFYQEFHQPLRSVLRKVCPEVKLLDLLQTIPEVNLKQFDRTWQITLNSPGRNF